MEVLPLGWNPAQWGDSCCDHLLTSQGTCEAYIIFIKRFESLRRMVSSIWIVSNLWQGLSTLCVSVQGLAWQGLVGAGKCYHNNWYVTRGNRGNTQYFYSRVAVSLRNTSSESLPVL